MRISYLRLDNFAGIYVGQGKDSIEIDFVNNINTIVSIQGRNGSAKSVLISTLTPFASNSSIDDRSSLSLIRTGHNGYKEIHYRKDDDIYIIKHYFKPTKDGGHSVKSYFNLNGEELNENGNVSSFNSLVEIHLGLTQEMMRLIRIGTNVNSFISLTPAKRKEYIGKLIEEIELYLGIYKKINEDIRLIKILLNTNSTNLYHCHVSDVMIEGDKLKELNGQLERSERERDDIIIRINKIKSLETENSIEELKRKQQESISSLSDFDHTEQLVTSMSLKNVNVDQLIDGRAKLSDEKINIQSNRNSYRISIDSTLKKIEKLELSVKKIAANHDTKSLSINIESLESIIHHTSSIIKSFIPPTNCTSSDVYTVISKLSSFNQISQMIYTFGDRPIQVYLKLRNENKSVDGFLQNQVKNNVSRVNSADLLMLFKQVFKEDQLIYPNCDTQFKECPYYRFSDMVTEFREILDHEIFDEETLRYIQVISNNIDNILNELDRLLLIHIPDALKEIMKETVILRRLESKLPFFELSSLYEYISIFKEFEIYSQNLRKLDEYRAQLAFHKMAGVDNQLQEIQQLQDDIQFYKNNISALDVKLIEISKQLDVINQQIILVTKYQDSLKYRKIVESTLESTNRILIPLESSSLEKIELTVSLGSINKTISSLKDSIKHLENKINEYNRLMDESDLLKKKYNDLNMILESVSTKKGIPVLYMRTYLGKIKRLTNNLLYLIYGDDLHLGNFKVTQETFEIPYIKGGVEIPDVRYASQSEIAFITMALSFALANKASGNYNILLLDEIDAGLDENNRSAFLTMLNKQMNELNIEQVFIISHNLSQMDGIHMDVIQLSELDHQSKLQNIIYC